MKFEDFEAIEKLRIKLNLEHAGRGVRFIDIRQAYIDEKAQIGKGTVIYPCVVLEGDVRIGENCIIGQNTRIVNSIVGDGTEIQSSVIINSSVGSSTTIGPFAYLRPDSHIGDRCKVGDFVEIKNASMGDGSKASHLSYIGDAEVGRDVNIGCGVVFVNYDGIKKHHTVVKDGAFVGCNVNLISPVVLEKDAYVAAGSTVTGNVPEGALYVERSPSKTYEGWVARKGILKKSKKGEEQK
jgi:bifunctional UDP-N-acetylglucosamine pyrophosphorylase / glucosamine-1-phosphate N-acetyltransferase